MVNNYAMPTTIYQNIPAFVNGKWTEISFESEKAFAEELETNYFKEIGEYEFDEYFHNCVSTRKEFIETGQYSDHIEGSPGFIKFWDFEKLKCRKGVFYINGNKKFYVSRYLYFWWNFTPIYDKKKKTEAFARVLDSHYHMDLYELIAQLIGLHAIGTKKRQFGSSLYHGAKQLNVFWFEPMAILQMGASLDDYTTGSKGTWNYVERYKNFLNSKTAWYRPLNPNAIGDWKQQHEETDPITNRTTEVGRKSVFTTTTFQFKPTNGVGGPTTIFYYEEAGIAKTMDITYEFMRPALEDGDDVTGQFIGFGSVGDLKECEPLKKYMYKPFENGFYGVPNKLANDKGIPIVTGLFISEVHSMSPYIDEWGNSLVEEAIIALQKKKKSWEDTLDPKLYALRCSQKPTWLDEAFRFRGEATFPPLLVQSQKTRIESDEFPYELIDLDYDEMGDITWKHSKRIPIDVFPIDPKAIDKRGAIQVWEKPVSYLTPLVTYYASIDPVGQGKTITSNSLCSIYIYRNLQIVNRIVDGRKESIQEGDKIVAAWCGRYDDISDTHDECIKLILWYQAWALCENNVPLLIDEMKRRKLQKYLVPSKQFAFNEEFDSMSKTIFQDYGWRNAGTIFKKVLLNYLLKFITNVLHTEKENSEDDETDVEKFKKVLTIKGIYRIPDIMACVEMENYVEGLNVDRLISLAALVTLVELQEAHRGGHINVVDDTEDIDYVDLDYTNKMSKLSKSPFNKLGKHHSSFKAKKKSPFNRLR